MKYVLLKRFRVNAFELKSDDCKISRENILEYGKHINEFLLKPKGYIGILYAEHIMDSVVVYAVGSMKECWLLVSEKFKGEEIIPLGVVKAEILGVEGKVTRRHIFTADCAGSMLKG